MATNGVSINASGVDTETLIETSIKSYQDRYDKVYKKKVEQEWTKEAYNTVYQDVKKYWNTDASNYKLSSYTTSRVASSSNSDIVTATVTADAVEMTHDIKVNSLASAAYLQTFDKVELGDKNTKADIAKMMGITVSDAQKLSDDIALSFVLNDGENEGVVSFTYKDLAEGKTLNDFASRINNLGLNLRAVYDSTNQSFSITNKDSGSDHSISITADVTKSAGYQKAASAVGEAKAELAAVAGLNYSQLDQLIKNKTAAADTLKYTDSDDSNYADVQQASADADTAYANYIAGLGLSSDQAAALDKYVEARTTLDRYGVDTAYETAAIDKAQAGNALTAAAAANSDEVDLNELDALIAEGDAGKINDYKAAHTSISSEIDAYITNVNAYNAANTTSSTQSAQMLSKLNFASYNAADGSFNKLDAAQLETGVSGTNASVTIDGKTYSDLQSNSITVANVNYTFSGVTTGSATKVTVSTDTDALIENVQNFVDSYNKLLDMLNEKVHETYYSDYGALTEDEESAMSESQLEKWNAKAQSGLLRKSSTLQSLIDSMREAISTKVEGIDGQYNSLASIGVSASGTWDEYGHLYVDTDKLKEAVNADPDVFYKLMSTNTKEYETQGVAFRLSDIMKNAMSEIEDQAGTTTGSDDQSYLGLKIQDYDKKLTSLQELIDTKYDFYYKKYSAMESAISNMQSTMNTLSSYLGISN